MSPVANDRNVRGARSSRALVEASRRDELPKTSKPEQAPPNPTLVPKLNLGMSARAK